MHAKTNVDAGALPPPPPVLVNDEEIAAVSRFKYLGSWKSSDGDCGFDVRTRIGMAKDRMLQLTNVWKDNNVSRQLKLRLMYALVWSVLLYGAESWTLRKADEKRIDSMEMWCYRRLLRVSWMERRSNDSIMQELGFRPKLLGIVKYRKLSYFGHMCRPSGCSLVRDVVLGVMEGKRKRGRPRLSYTDNIVSWTNKSLHQNIQLSRDRALWREHCKASAFQQHNAV